MSQIVRMLFYNKSKSGYVWFVVLYSVITRMDLILEVMNLVTKEGASCIVEKKAQSSS
jgi:hypothetical protein